MRRLLAAASLVALSIFARGDFVLARCTIVSQRDAAPAEVHAAKELRDTLAVITGADIPLVKGADSARPNSIIIGQGAVSRALFSDVNWGKLAAEQTLLKCTGDTMLIAGGSPRGTLYGVYRFLQTKCGVRWWAPWATTIPKNPNLSIGALTSSEVPAFEYREPYWFHSFDTDWAAHNFSNGHFARLDAAHGGKIEYQGFVHTYYGLAPPEKLFAAHPDWFSLINGKRTTENAQLCTTNPQLREYIVGQVSNQLRAHPEATIASVSQNDCFNPCQCDRCRALVNQEGSESALVLDLANYVADHIAKEFPNVAVDTLAYQWSRHPPKEMKPRPNVIVRLCSIECNFGYPLSDAQNATFNADIQGWNRLTNRLYVWDYCTNFAGYLQPMPDYFSLGKTLKWFSQNGVKGVFEEGAYQSYGGDMAELKAWVISQMLWDPKQDPDALVDEFLKGYYGEKAAVPIRKYLDLMAEAVKGHNVTFAQGPKEPFLNYDVLKHANRLWTEARELSRTEGRDFFVRVGTSSLSQESVWLSHWQEFKSAALAAKDTWPYPSTRQEAADQWLSDCARSPTPITIVDEGGMTPARFVQNLGPEPPAPTK